jgi:hypothetical protein
MIVALLSESGNRPTAGRGRFDTDLLYRHSLCLFRNEKPNTHCGFAHELSKRQKNLVRRIRSLVHRLVVPKTNKLAI